MKPPKLLTEFKALRQVHEQLREIVGDGRPASEIVDIATELERRIEALGLEGTERAEFRWRLAEQAVRGRTHMTRDGQLLVGGPDDRNAEVN